MTGYFINMTLAAILAGATYGYKWWLPAIVFPAWILVSPVIPLAPELVTPGRVNAMRWYFYILAVVYMITQAVIFQVHVGSWFGWIIGLLIGWAVGGTLAGKLEPKLMHSGLP